MLEVDLKMVPFGVRSAAKSLGKLRIANDGTGTHEVGNYKVRLNQPDAPAENWRVEGWDRSQSAWELVGECLATRPGRLDDGGEVCYNAPPSRLTNTKED